MKLIWLPQAEHDLDECVAYIAQDDPVAAFDLFETIILSVSRNLPEHPQMGRSGRVEGTREWIAHKNYIVVYRIKTDANAIEVLSVYHAARLWPDRF